MLMAIRIAWIESVAGDYMWIVFMVTAAYCKIPKTCRAQTTHWRVQGIEKTAFKTYNSSGHSYSSLLIMLRSEQGRILQCSQSLISSISVICTGHKVRTSHHRELCPAKDSIWIEIGDFQLLFQLFLSEERPLGPNSFFRHNCRWY